MRKYSRKYSPKMIEILKDALEIVPDEDYIPEEGDTPCYGWSLSDTDTAKMLSLVSADSWIREEFEKIIGDEYDDDIEKVKDAIAKIAEKICEDQSEFENEFKYWSYGDWDEPPYGFPPQDYPYEYEAVINLDLESAIDAFVITKSGYSA